MLVDITNAEFVASLGADLIMLNIFDVNNPVIQGLPQVPPEETIREVKRLTGRMTAINLEPAIIKNEEEKSVWNLTEGRRATVENARKAADMGVDMIILTGNPGVGVDNEAIIQALSKLKEAAGDFLQENDYIPTLMETQNSIMKRRSGEVRLPSDHNGNK